MGIFGTIQKGVAFSVKSIANPISNIIKKGSGTATTASVMKNPVTNILTKAATVGIVGASALGVAGAVKSAGGVVATATKIVTSTPAKSVASVIVKNPVKSVLGAGVVAGGGLALVPKVYETAKGATQIAVPVLLGDKPLTSGNVGDVAKTIGIVAGAGALAVGAGYVAKEILSKEEKAEVLGGTAKMAIAEGASGVPITPTPPITPETVSMEETPVKKPTETASGTKINQRVSVRVSQSQRNKSHNRTTKYINKRRR